METDSNVITSKEHSQRTTVDRSSNAFSRRLQAVDIDCISDMRYRVYCCYIKCRSSLRNELVQYVPMTARRQLLLLRYWGSTFRQIFISVIKHTWLSPTSALSRVHAVYLRFDCRWNYDLIRRRQNELWPRYHDRAPPPPRRSIAWTPFTPFTRLTSKWRHLALPYIIALIEIWLTPIV